MWLTSRCSSPVNDEVAAHKLCKVGVGRSWHKLIQLFHVQTTLTSVFYTSCRNSTHPHHHHGNSICHSPPLATFNGSLMTRLLSQCYFAWWYSCDSVQQPKLLLSKLMLQKCHYIQTYFVMSLTLATGSLVLEDTALNPGPRTSRLSGDASNDRWLYLLLCYRKSFYLITEQHHLSHHSMAHKPQYIIIVIVSESITT